MAYKNGKIPRSVLKPITICANGERGYLLEDAADAFNAMNAESERRFSLTLRATSARCTYRDIMGQEFFWHEMLYNRGALAAKPGTSNHGLGETFDLATTRMRQIVDRIGAKYGFAKKWSDAQSEWWHIKWNRSKVTAAAKKIIAAGNDPLNGYTAWEKETIRKYDDWRRRKVNKKGQKRLAAEMLVQRRVIWRIAQPKSKGGDGRGWSYGRRLDRFESLHARS